MPDLDDIFEDAFDAIKKIWYKRSKAKKSRKEKYRKGKPTSLDRVSPSANNQTISSKQQAQNQQVAQRSLHSTPTTGIQNSELRGHLEQAQAYERGILDLMRNAPTEFNRSRMEELTRYIDQWQRSLYALIERVEQFQNNQLLQNDLKAVPKAIQRLEAQLSEDPPQRIEKELQRTLANRQQQLSSLTDLRETMQWAEVKIENTISMLGTLYSQATMSQSHGQMGNYQRLLAELQEESLSLNDYVSTLNEIKFGDG